MNENAGRPYRARLGFAALLGTVVLVVGAKSATGIGAHPSALAVAPATTSTSTGADAGTGTGTGSSSGSSSSSSTGTGTGTGSGTGTGTSPDTDTGSASGTTTRTVTGDAVYTRFGFVQVQVVLTGDKITNVVPVQIPDRERRDREINDQAVPLLRQEVLDAQSAQIDVISGASYTSQGYAQSVQSALDAAGV
ncbi:FMN-binding protein [Frankia sp. Mgl5]|uniref:FMN-binding protein n=1 Tax=Frankia sp. Mgl5 TaxID=2933793 RepID=UPI00200CE996|nr:FMN-binding protein [Frankia sp. Mgl5]MCK9926656.1 FMN-binding protein [Frankia sp. Mgl5]